MSQTEPRAAITRITETLYRASIASSPLDDYDTRDEAEEALRRLGQDCYAYYEPTTTKTIIYLD
jgi:hypothetical protein